MFVHNDSFTARVSLQPLQKNFRNPIKFRFTKFRNELRPKGRVKAGVKAAKAVADGVCVGARVCMHVCVCMHVHVRPQPSDTRRLMRTT